MTTLPPTRSRREATKARTRQALIDAALELFAANGYDETSIDAVAERAGVSPRTFFRYFDTKELVLFFGEYDFIRSFTGVYLAQPHAGSEVDAVRDAFLILAPGLTRLKGRIARYHDAVASSPLLRGREQEHHAENHRTIALALAQRRELHEPDEDCLLLASMTLALLRHALERWVRSPGGDLVPFIDDAFRRLARLLDAP